MFGLVASALRQMIGWSSRGFRLQAEDLLFGAERKHSLRIVILARLENRRREIALVRRVREMLRLEAQPAAMRVDVTSLPLDRAVKKIARVELQPRLGGANLQGAAALWIRKACRH